MYRQVKELRQANEDRLAARSAEYGVISANISQLQAAVVSLGEQISLVTEGDKAIAKPHGDDDQHRQHLIEEIIKQAAFVSTATLDARLQDLRTQLEAMIDGGGGGAGSATQQLSDQQTTRIELFEKALGDLKVLLSSQKSDLESKVRLSSGLNSFLF